jgi:hypothetical protein
MAKSEIENMVAIDDIIDKLSIKYPEVSIFIRTRPTINLDPAKYIFFDDWEEAAAGRINKYRMNEEK